MQWFVLIEINFRFVRDHIQLLVCSRAGAEPNQFKIVEIIWAQLDDRLPRLADVGFAVRKGLLENAVLPLSVVVGVVVLYEWY